MRKLLFMLALLLLSLSNCTQKSPEKNKNEENALLAKEVIIAPVFEIENLSNPEWTAGLKKDEFLRKSFEKVLSRQIPVYGASPVYFGDKENKTPYPIERINEIMHWKDNNMNFSELKELLFYEKWYFNPNNLKFSKKVEGWCPIRVWGEAEKPSKKMLFFAYPENKDKGNQIAKSIFYEFPWEIEYATLDVGFDKLAFLKFIFEGIKSDKITAYDPIYLVDKSKRKFKPEELKKYIGEDLNAGIVGFNMSSILFEEDWYFDENTLSIQKDVKSIAFVNSQYDPKTDTFPKKILFFIFPKE